MIIINVLCLPKEQTEEDFRSLRKALQTAIIGMSGELDIEKEDINILPFTLKECGLGSNVTIEAMLFSPPKEITGICDRLAKSVGQNVKVCYPETEVVIHAKVFVPNGIRGCWISSR